MKRRPLGLIIGVGLTIGLLQFVFSDCAKKEPVLLGFAAELTGRQAELGVQERNGAQLAVETINASGGVAGRPLELMVHDDLGKPEGARAAVRALIDAGALAIIGHATSSQTLAGLPVANAARIVLLSPTTSTPELNDLDDWFFRVISTSVDGAHKLAQNSYRRRGVKRIAVVYDTDNAAYTKPYLDAFKKSYRSQGGEVVGEVGFASSAQVDFAPLLSNLRVSDADGLLIIAAGFDTALIAQRARMIGWSIPLFTSAWAQSEKLITHGGQAVEGMDFDQAYDLNSRSPAFLEFKARYQSRFGHAPSFGAAYGYEAVLVLAAALRQTGGRAEGLRPALLAIRNFQGLIDTFSFNNYGDVMRPFYLGTIRDGGFVTLETDKSKEP
ncbi:MAG: ABC transporter substrate-binding protein [Thermodesulfobacteriota bacterium]